MSNIYWGTDFYENRFKNFENQFFFKFGQTDFKPVSNVQN